MNAVELALELPKYGVVGIIFGLLATVIFVIKLLSQSYKQHQDMFNEAMKADTEAKMKLATSLQELTDVVRSLR